MLVMVIAAVCGLLAATLAGSHQLAFAFQTWVQSWHAASR